MGKCAVFCLNVYILRDRKQVGISEKSFAVLNAKDRSIHCVPLGYT